MIADRVVLLPGTVVGSRAVMGSGALGKRNGVYDDGSTWIGNGESLPPIILKQNLNISLKIVVKPSVSTRVVLKNPERRL
jgi:hypothetical protein